LQVFKMETKPALYHFYTSFFSQKAKMFLYEKEIEFDGRVVNLMTNETQSSWYLEVNPRGEVPAMKFGDDVVNGSDKILDYIEANKLGKRSLYPTDPDLLSKHNQFYSKLEATDIEKMTYGTAFHPHIRNNKKHPIKWPFSELMKNHMINRSKGLRKKAEENAGTPAEAALLAKAEEHDAKMYLFTSEDEHKKILQGIKDLLDEIEKELSSHKDVSWLIDDNFSAADCLLAIILNRLDFVGHEDYMSPKVRPFLAAWWSRTKDRKSFLAVTKSHPSIPLYFMKSKLGLV